MNFPKFTDGETVFFLIAIIFAVLLIGGLLIWFNDRFSNRYE